MFAISVVHSFSEPFSPRRHEDHEGSQKPKSLLLLKSLQRFGFLRVLRVFVVNKVI